MNSAVVIGTSAGGLKALEKIFSALSKNFIFPLLIVLHRHSDSDDFLPKYFNTISSLHFKEAEEKETVKKGYAYIAPADYHLLVEEDFTLSLNVDEKVFYCRPAIDVLFETAAEVYGENLIGIVLTGANEDGTKGMETIKKLGGLTVVQDPKYAEVDYMPRSVINNVKVDYILNLNEIADLLNALNETNNMQNGMLYTGLTR
jgi:two-component system chemotaxis response regulator CheB